MSGFNYMMSCLVRISQHGAGYNQECNSEESIEISMDDANVNPSPFESNYTRQSIRNFSRKQKIYQTPANVQGQACVFTSALIRSPELVDSSGIPVDDDTAFDSFWEEGIDDGHVQS